jgi:outer membrane protein assembly factor BamE (lipoprotein component of BamABCDE complex)
MVLGYGVLLAFWRNVASRGLFDEGKTTMHRFLLCSLWSILVVVFGLLLTGCTYSEKRAETSAEPVGAVSASGAESAQAGSLSYGNITSRIEKGVTTQADLVELFGGPSISTIDSNGSETWVYERTASESDVSGEGQSTVEARRLDCFFGLGYLTTGDETRRGTGTLRHRHSIKTLTVVIKFNENKTVNHYSARASRF